MSEVRVIDFNSLHQPVRERLIACFEGKSSPSPIIKNVQGSGCALVGWILLLVICVGSGIALVHEEFGAFTRGLPAFVALIVYFGGGFLTVMAAISVARSIWWNGALPFKPGVYLFATDIVDARHKELRIIPARLWSAPQLTHHLRNGVYQYTAIAFNVAGAGQETFTVNGKQLAEQNVQALWQAQQELAHAAQAQDWQRVWWLDLFFDHKNSGQWEAPPGPERDRPPLAKSMPFVYRQRAAIAAVLALVTAPCVLGARYVINDELSIANAREMDKEWAWEYYVDNYRFHLDEAKQRQPLAALREAKEKKTVSAMRELLKKYKGASIENDARAHLHSLYEKTLDDFKRKASGRDPAMLDFMGRLIAYLERADVTTVYVAFKPPTSDALAEVDRTLADKFKRARKEIAPIAPHFAAERVSGRQSAIVNRLNSAFGQIFPTDVMKLEAATTQALGESPAIEIGYVVGPSGDIYTSDTDPRAYVGIIVDFEMAMRIPADARPFGFKVQVEPPDHFRTSGTGDQVVYDTMTERAFDELDAKLQNVFFGAPPAAPSGAEAQAL